MNEQSIIERVVMAGGTLEINLHSCVDGQAFAKFQAVKGIMEQELECTPAMDEAHGGDSQWVRREYAYSGEEGTFDLKLTLYL